MTTEYGFRRRNVITICGDEKAARRNAAVFSAPPWSDRVELVCRDVSEWLPVQDVEKAS